MPVKKHLSLLIVLALFSMLAIHCGDDDDDDDSDGPAPDDDDDDIADDDDNDDDSTSDDDDDDDDDDQDGTLIQDDGSAESGFSAICTGCTVVQGFTPDEYPLVLRSVRLYIDSSNGLENPVKLAVYYDDDESGPPFESVYESDLITFDKGDDWTTIDLSDATGLQSYPVVQGSIYVGLLYTVDSGNGPWIGWDQDSSPDDRIWYFNPFTDEWTHLVDYGYTGVLMIRPKLTPME